MIRESKNCSEVTKRHFNKELVMTKKLMKILRTLLNVGSVIILILVMMLNCHITGKFRGSAHRNCNINVKSNYKTPVVFHNLKNMDTHHIMQKMSYQMNWKNMSFNINNK